MPYDYLTVVNARASRFDGYAVNSNRRMPHKNTNALLVLLGAKKQSNKQLLHIYVAHTKRRFHRQLARKCNGPVGFFL